MFQGSLVALVTPMTSSGALDEKRLADLIERHIEAGTKGLVLGGTTGEASTLNEIEKEKLLKIGLEVANRRIPVIMGTGTNDTVTTVRETEQAKALGADACLVVTPYYNKPTQEGLYQHYLKVASVSIPILLYNVSSRTACDLLPETVARLAKVSNIIGMKEASSDLARGRSLLELCGQSFSLFSGDDASALAFMLQGGKGVISVTANVAPKMMQEMCQAALEGNVHQAGALNAKLMSLHKTLFVETNPIPVKWAVQQLGWIEGGIRLPLTELSNLNQTVVKEAMKESGVLN